MIVRNRIQCPARPRLVFGYADSVHAARVARYFRRLGWQVHLAGSGREACRLVHDVRPDLVILDTELADESGWLAAAKLLLVQEHRVLIVGVEREARHEQFAKFIGAAGYFTRTDDPDCLMLEGLDISEPAVVG
jgi:DNA-binding response OmpR family regulator